MAHNATLIQAALEHTCPKCCQPTGHDCRRRDGQVMAIPHSIRYACIPY